MRRLATLFLAALAVLPLAPAATPPATPPAKPAPKAPAKPPAKTPVRTAPKKAPSPKFSNAYASPTSKKRPTRKSTRFIILHTTEGALTGSLAKLSRNGEAHYLIDRDGVIYRIVDRRKVAMHCGKSMWNNVSNLSDISVGIELDGYHDKELTAKQYASLRYLLNELKRIYKVPDDRILTHSMVAYDGPNAWHKKNHRGRKRCAMLLADPARRRRFGVLSKPAYDPDLRAGRLTDGDPELTRILYGSNASSKPAPSKPASATKPAPPPKPATPAPPKSPSAKPAAPAPAKPTATPPKPATPSPAKPAAPAPAKSATPSPAKPATAAPPKPAPAKPVAAGSNIIGPSRSAWDIARERYNAPTTIYRFPDGSQKKGSEIRNWKTLPAGTTVTYQE